LSASWHDEPSPHLPTEVVQALESELPKVISDARAALDPGDPAEVVAALARLADRRGFDLPDPVSPFNHRLVHLLRKRWNIATVKINAGAENPPCWSDGTYSVQGAAHALGVTAHTIFAWLKSGRLAGHHLAKGMPWQITLTDEKIP
jgi:hypothetical protein